MKTHWIITCEHGGNTIPTAYADLFSGADALAALQTHEGYDIGVMNMFDALRGAVADWSQHSTVSRLLIDLNRSANNPERWSRFTRDLPPAQHNSIAATYHTPYWDGVRTEAMRVLQENNLRICHISVHTFTGLFQGQKRNVDIGFLCNEDRAQEVSFCTEWMHKTKDVLHDLRLHINQPYNGASDGLTTAMRTQFGERYLGIELEVNQNLTQPHIITALRDTLITMK